MTDLPRYQVFGDNDNCQALDPDGDWVKWGDVSARLQQLAQEQATLAAIHKQELENFAASWDEQAAMLNAAEDAREKAEAALAETRDALHQLTEKYESLVESQRESLTRGDGP